MFLFSLIFRHFVDAYVYLEICRGPHNETYLCAPVREPLSMNQVHLSGLDFGIVFAINEIQFH